MSRWITVGVLATVLAGGGLWARAQQVLPNNPRVTPNVQPTPQIISGADFGFRVDAVAPDGSPRGKIVVRQNGQWVEIGITGSARRLDVVK